jgi:hypothetical protein
VPDHAAYLELVGGRQRLAELRRVERGGRDDEQ